LITRHREYELIHQQSFTLAQLLAAIFAALLDENYVSSEVRPMSSAIWFNVLISGHFDIGLGIAQYANRVGQINLMVFL